MEKKKPGRVRVKSINHNSYYDYKKDSQKNLSRDLPGATLSSALLQTPGQRNRTHAQRDRFRWQ